MHIISLLNRAALRSTRFVGPTARAAIPNPRDRAPAFLLANTE